METRYELKYFPTVIQIEASMIQVAADYNLKSDEIKIQFVDSYQTFHYYTAYVWATLSFFVEAALHFYCDQVRLQGNVVLLVYC